jgi:hypothetical protein
MIIIHAMKLSSGAGLLPHTGGRLEWLAPDVLAAPWWRVL